MKKNLTILLFAMLFVSCFRDPNIKEITSSFGQFLENLETRNTTQLDINMPFLSTMTSQEQSSVLDPFRTLGTIKYTLEISKQSETIYYLQINTKDPESIWTDLFIPYEQNSDGNWVMAPVIKSVQTFDIVPAQN